MARISEEAAALAACADVVGPYVAEGFQAKRRKAQHYSASRRQATARVPGFVEQIAGEGWLRSEQNLAR